MGREREREAPAFAWFEKESGREREREREKEGFFFRGGGNLEGKMLDDEKSERILKGLEAAVLEEQQVVSFKWVAREYDVNVKQARRLLEHFATHGVGKDKCACVLYLVGQTRGKEGEKGEKGGQLLVKLVDSKRLALEEKRMYVRHSSVYAVQPSVLRDPNAALWNAESEYRNSLVQKAKREGEKRAREQAEKQRESGAGGGASVASAGEKKKEVGLDAEKSSGVKRGISLGGIRSVATTSPAKRKSIGISLDSKKKVMKTEKKSVSLAKKTPVSIGVSKKMESPTKRKEVPLEREKSPKRSRVAVLEESSGDEDEQEQEQEQEMEVEVEPEVKQKDAPPPLSLVSGQKKQRYKTVINEKGEEETICIDEKIVEVGGVENIKPSAPQKKASAPQKKATTPQKKAQGKTKQKQQSIASFFSRK